MINLYLYYIIHIEISFSYNGAQLLQYAQHEEIIRKTLI